MSAAMNNFGATALVLIATSASAGNGFEWASGVGTTPCSELSSISDTELAAWVHGYWTGANLYLGGTDLCEERSAIANVDSSAVRTLIEVHCVPVPNKEIMFSAFNALKGLPKIPGSRSAACERN